MKALCTRVRLVINCTGPFRFYGDQVVKACVEAGTNYCVRTKTIPHIPPPNPTTSCCTVPRSHSALHTAALNPLAPRAANSVRRTLPASPSLSSRCIDDLGFIYYLLFIELDRFGDVTQPRPGTEPEAYARWQLGAGHFSVHVSYRAVAAFPALATLRCALCSRHSDGGEARARRG